MKLGLGDPGSIFWIQNAPPESCVKYIHGTENLFFFIFGQLPGDFFGFRDAGSEIRPKNTF